MTLLDAYAVVAYLRDEHAAGAVAAILQSDVCAVTALGFAEVIDRMVRLEGVGEDELARDLADLGLSALIAVDQGLASTAGLLRARHYHRTRRSVSMADCVGAAAARQLAEPLATSDSHLLDLCQQEGVDTIVLPGSDGSIWTSP